MRLIQTQLTKYLQHLGECASHALLSSYGLAPALLSRFNNGLMYRFVAGRVCTAKDLSSRDVYLPVAERLGEWHGVLPVGGTQPPAQDSLIDPINLTPATENNLWGILQKWTEALPSDTPAQAARKLELVDELRFLTEESGLKGRDGGVGLIFGHCDLLNGNIIILPEGRKECVDKPTKEKGLDAGIDSGRKVHFIDYEYVFHNSMGGLSSLLGPSMSSILPLKSYSSDTQPLVKERLILQTTSLNGVDSNVTTAFFLRSLPVESLFALIYNPTTYISEVKTVSPRCLMRKLRN